MTDLLKDVQDLIDQIEPPPFIFKVKKSVSDNRAIRFHLNTHADFSGLNVENDPIKQLLIDRCISTQVDMDNKRIIIGTGLNPYNMMRAEMNQYFCIFLQRHMERKHPRTSKLYKWVDRYLDNHGSASMLGLFDDQFALYQYLIANVGGRGAAKDNVHVKNGLGILERLKIKYEAKGLTL